MAAINGTALLLYEDGTAIALQKGVSITVETDLPDATNKESAGWARHINGLRSAKIDFNGLFSTAGLDAEDLADYIISREEMLVSLVGLGYPILGWADMSSISFAAPQEGAMTCSGSMKINGELAVCVGSNLLTNADSGGTDYETSTLAAGNLGFSSLINSAGTAYAKSNTFAVTSASVYKLLIFITLTSGQLPDVALFEVSGAAISNVETLKEGLNLVTLTATDTHDGCLNISNTDATSLATSSIYLYKV